ncbi:UDP-N-acetylmuramyl tripeptide synthase [Friedmanniella luteola]|uniref:UDP-N-acetylmuramyl tripeptide synthase n=1 Tax=Friedmanniella luteola TaxID=546871 RepID=A0A1H1PRJ1_9ACTN|nr:Mur ligase family protein [Friedmanniella luteola]SDS13716.1 UDP-N-acetylmuramyl tripeptide synthase [Friedmanniella luteola]
MPPEPSSALVEVRLLVGPNLYFPRPAAKLTLDVSHLLGLPEEQARDVAAALGLPGARPGPAASAFRQRAVARWAARLVRRLAAEAGVARLAVRSRPGTVTEQLVVAYPWRSSGRAEALGTAVAAVLDALAAGTPAGALEPVLVEAGARVRSAPRGRGPSLLKPQVPVVAVTGTNGKTTTSRMIGHVAQRAGWSVGWSSTDGVYLDGVLVEAGDFSGPSGAGQVLRHPGVQLAVTETARGGILRRGVGVAWNDVSVVTNISSDHLGVDGIDTLDQLAEVKAVITKITRPGGWCVLNADDPRTFAMRSGTRAGIWAFTRDPDSPSGRAVLDAGGRVSTVLDGWVAVLRAGADPLAVVQVADVPMTLAGLSRVNVENALAVASATLALGFSPEQVADGLTSFRPGEDNPGRMNLWTVPRADGGSVTVVVDLAHNEAGLEALLEIMAGVRRPGARLLLGVGTAGDRGDDVLVRLGEIAALGADVVEVARKSEYYRGRPPEEMGRLIAEGAAHAGVAALREHADELTCLVSLTHQAGDGDVVALMTHQDREAVDRWLVEQGASRDDPATLRAKVRAAAETPTPPDPA